MSTQEEVDEFLAHFGVKGMHWGVRTASSNEEEGRGDKSTGKSSSPHHVDKKTVALAVGTGGVGLLARHVINNHSEGRLAKTDRKIAKTKANIDAHNEAIKNIKSHVKDANDNGVDSELFKQKYGTASPTLFKTLHGTSVNEALADHKESLQDELADRTFSRDMNTARLSHLQTRRAKIVAKSS